MGKFSLPLDENLSDKVFHREKYNRILPSVLNHWLNVQSQILIKSGSEVLKMIRVYERAWLNSTIFGHFPTLWIWLFSTASWTLWRWHHWGMFSWNSLPQAKPFLSWRWLVVLSLASRNLKFIYRSWLYLPRTRLGRWHNKGSFPCIPYMVYVKHTFFS